MKKIFYILLTILVFWGCKQAPEPVSPINITAAEKDSALRPLLFNFEPADTLTLQIKDSTLILKFSNAALILPDTNLVGQDYPLQYVKFVFPSEHQVNGKNYDGEVQLFFNRKGKWVAVSYFIEKGDTNHYYDLIVANLPQNGTKTFVDTNGFFFRNLMPYGISYWKYEGTFVKEPYHSLTWFILQTPVQLSEGQISELEKASKPKNIPVHSYNGKISEF